MSPKGLLQEPDLETSAHDLVGILSAVEETAYTWDIITDKIDWESNAASVLRLGAGGILATGTAFQMLIAPEHVAVRQEAIAGARGPEPGKSVPFRVQYRFAPAGRRSDAVIWLEDIGVWAAGPDRQPAVRRAASFASSTTATKRNSAYSS